MGVFASTAILSLLPEEAVNALNYLLPSLFGAIFIQFAMKKFKIAPIALGLGILMTIAVNAGVFSFLPGRPTYMVTLITVFGTIGIATTLYKKKLL